MAGRRFLGGIVGLILLIEEHRAALRYDWRTRFGRGLDESVPDDIGWDEALDLVRILRADPSTQLAASVEEWEYPLSREAAILADVWDLEYAKAGTKKREVYPRPFKMKSNMKRERIGDASGKSRDEVVTWLRSLGHNVN